MILSFLKSAMKRLPISIILLSLVLSQIITTEDAFETEYNFVYANIELLSESEFISTANFSTVDLEKEAKYGLESRVSGFQGRLCIPRIEDVGFEDGCSVKDYRVCENLNRFVAMVSRSECDMYDMAEYAKEQSVIGLLIVETSAKIKGADLKEYDQAPHKFKSYKTTSLDQSFNQENARKREAGIPFIICTKETAIKLESFVRNGFEFLVKVSDGGFHEEELRPPTTNLLPVFLASTLVTITLVFCLVFCCVKQFGNCRYPDKVNGQQGKCNKEFRNDSHQETQGTRPCTSI